MSTKGKKRAIEEEFDSGSLSPTPEVAPVKRSRKIPSKECPICDEEIPIRLLEHHTALEIQRMEVFGQLPPPPLSDLVPKEYEGTSEPGPSTTRKAALRARKSISARQPTRKPLSTNVPPAPSASSPFPHHSIPVAPATAASIREVRALQRNRRTRHAKAKEISRAIIEDLDSAPAEVEASSLSGSVSTCPICQLPITTGETLTEHVDRCLAETEARREYEEIQRLSATDPGFAEEIYDLGNGETRIRLTSITGFAGTGFTIRDTSQQDVDDELDIEGNDEDVFGNAQFDEGDILPIDPDAEIDILNDAEDDDPPGGVRTRTLRDLVAGGAVSSRESATPVISGVEKEEGQQYGAITVSTSVEDIDVALRVAQDSGDKDAVIALLMRKISNPTFVPTSFTPPAAHSSDSSLAHNCRICLDPYTDPTVSVACWHIFCNTCWLRCLGSTKLCPICKHISAAGNLRRVYL